jgi:hypothetical protein
MNIHEVTFDKFLLPGIDLKYDSGWCFEPSSWQVGSVIKPQVGGRRILLIRPHAGG